MKLWYKSIAVVITAAATCVITSCSAPAGFSYHNVSVALSVQCGDCPTPTYNPAYPAPAVSGQPAPAGSVVLEPNTGQGGVYIFTATVTNAPANVTWALYPTPNLTDPTPPSGTTTPVGESGSQVGTLTSASGSSVYYTQNGVPVYTGAALAQAQAMGIPQGDVLLVATVPADPNNSATVATASQLIQIYGGSTAQGPPTVYLTPRTPTTPAGLTNPVATIAHNGGTLQFYGGVVGAAPCITTTTCNAIAPNTPLNTTDNGAQWFVGPAPCGSGAPPLSAVQGGSSTYGTISATGLYTAPATIPVTQPAVYINSHLVSSVSGCANIAIN